MGSSPIASTESPRSDPFSGATGLGWQGRPGRCRRKADTLSGRAKAGRRGQDGRPRRSRGPCGSLLPVEATWRGIVDELPASPSSPGDRLATQRLYRRRQERIEFRLPIAPFSREGRHPFCICPSLSNLVVQLVDPDAESLRSCFIFGQQVSVRRDAVFLSMGWVRSLAPPGSGGPAPPSVWSWADAHHPERGSATDGRTQYRPFGSGRGRRLPSQKQDRYVERGTSVHRPRTKISARSRSVFRS